MRKRLLSLFISVCLLVFQIPIVSYASIRASGTCGENLTWTLDDIGTLTINGRGNMTNYDSASDVPWRFFHSTISYVIINPGVTSIGKYAFYNLENVKSVTIPDGIVSIENYAFASCSNNLQRINIPESVLQIGSYAFYFCTALTEITIPNNVTKIGASAFRNCDSLTHIEIPDSVTSIGSAAFASCNMLTSVNLSKNITKINSHTFNNCQSLTNITFYKGVTSIGVSAFYGCVDLKSVIIPDSIESIGNEAFWICENLTDVYYTGNKSEWKNISIGSKNAYFTDATIHYNYKTETDDDNNGANNNFQIDIYRANHLTTSEVGSIMEDTYININKTPGKVLYDAGQENGLDDAAAAWTAVMDTLNAVDNPSSIADYVFEEKDIYSAIIMNMFENSVDYEFMEYIDNEITKQSKSLIGTVTSSMKNLYNFDVIDAEAVRNMTDKQKEDFEKELKEAYKGVHGTASTTSDITKIISNGIKYGKDIQKICETIEVYKNIRDLSDSMKFVMRKMYDKCPNSNTSLKAALLECIAVIDSGKTAFTAEMTLYSVGIIGKDVAQAGVDKLWGSVKTSYSVAHPAAFAFQTAYSVGKYVTQVCYNADAIVEKYYNLVAMVNIEQVMDLVYNDIKSSFQADSTQFNATVYNNVVDVMFNMKDTDCDYVIAYAEAIDSSLASKLATAFGDNTVEELKQSVKSIQSSTSLFHVTVLTDWITQLYEDDIDKYYDYEYLIDKSYESYRKKYNINCPVDVYIYDLDGNIVGSVVDDVVFCAEGSDITILVGGDKKTIYMNNADEYNIVYEGNDNGTMDITITEYDEMKSTVRSVNFNNIVLTDGLTYTSSENGTTLTENAYVLMDETEECIEPDYDSLTAMETETHIVEITRGYFTDTMDVSRQLNYGQNVEITAYIPEGYEFVSWTSDSSEDIFEDSCSITTKITMPVYDVNIVANVIKCPTLSIAEFTESNLKLKAINCENITSGAVVLAIYNEDGSLNYIKIENFAEAINFKDLNLTNGKAKVMLLDSLDSLMPLTKATEKMFFFETTEVQ